MDQLIVAKRRRQNMPEEMAIKKVGWVYNDGQSTKKLCGL